MRTLRFVIAALVCCETRGFLRVTSSPWTVLSRSASSSKQQLFWSKQCITNVATNKPEILDTTVRLLQQGETSTVNLDSPRTWLEHLPPGVYTVMRGDLWVGQQGKQPSWHLWDMDFHITRLQQSYITLYHHPDEKLALERAREDSQSIVESLVAQTRDHVRKTMDSAQPNTTVVVMLTLLWHPNENGNIRVQGHVFTSAKALDPRQPTSPIHLALAVGEESLPNRKDHHPECKQSTWCTQRRPLEQIYKKEGIDEVLLVQQQEQGDTCILEGLTSNCFFVYPGKVIKTPNQNILKGYARHRVIQAAQVLGYQVDQGPISLQEAHLWKQVFLTSAIKLCQPVKSINHQDAFAWQCEDSTDESCACTDILHRILDEESL